MSSIINASTSSGLIQTADTSGTLELQSGGTTKFTVSSTGAYGQVVSSTAVASTSGTSIDFTSIPSWAKRITVIFNGVSLNSTSNFLIQLGAGSVTTSGYSSSGYAYGGAATSTAGTVIISGAASRLTTANTVICLISSNTWVTSSVYAGDPSASGGGVSTGTITLGGTLDRVRITTVSGTDTFDAGSINIMYEG